MFRLCAAREPLVVANDSMRAGAPQPAAPRDRRAGLPHVIFVYLVFYPDTSSSSMLFGDLFRRLSAEGLRVTVLCGFPAKDGSEEVRRVPRHEWIDGVEIIRCGLRVEGKRDLRARALSYGSFLLHAGFQLLRRGGGATVLGGTDPPFTAVFLYLLTRLRRLRYQCVILDLYPDGLVGIGKLTDGSPITRVWRALNRRAYRAADRILVIARDTIPLLQRVYGVDPGKVTYIPHWSAREVDDQAVAPRGALLNRLGLEHKFVIQYSGNMGLWHDMDCFVRAAELLRDDGHIHFLFIGKGMRRARAEQLSRDLGLTNVTWLDFVPREQLAESLASCDASLISLRAGLEGVAVPSKLYGILAVGRPVIAQVPAESEVAFTVREAACGSVVPPGDAAALAAACRALAADPAAAAAMGARARDEYRRKYTIENAADMYLTLWSEETPK